MRLKLKLEEFDYTIVYKKGKENSNSDGLSRMYPGSDGDKSVRVMTDGNRDSQGQEAEGKEITAKEKM
jgi:hypothetical protein